MTPTHDVRAVLEAAASVVRCWSLPTIQAPSMWLIDKAGIEAAILELVDDPRFAAPARLAGGDEKDRVITALRAEVARKDEALNDLKRQFEFYARVHTAAGKSIKAAVNEHYAGIARTALAAAQIKFCDRVIDHLEKTAAEIKNAKQKGAAP
jgi:hypothetical protein